MDNVAILVGNVDYLNMTKLECCHDDVMAIKKLLEATEKYAHIEVIENAIADDLKSHIRSAIDKSQSSDEIFFYYTGHGFVHETESEFFFCATNFDSKRPNETGISLTDLHTLLKLGNAGLVVTIIDACYSGTRLVKADDGLVLPRHKQDFKNLIQIASCLDSQESLTGKPLSVFTEKFCTAVLRKEDGIVYYLDIINTLKDEFLGNDSQIPFIVSQYTGREQFVDDAHKLDRLRTELRQPVDGGNDQLQIEQPTVPTTRTLLDVLQMAESKIVKPEIMQTFVGTLFDNCKKSLPIFEFADYFGHEFTEHSDFRESTATEFITRVMSRENRPDNFVTASISRKRKPDPWGLGITSLMYRGYNPDDYIEYDDLDLNCSMPRTQLKLAFNPKFSYLRRMILVITCAPSLERCYVFEIATEHLLTDFGKFDVQGNELTQRWYKFQWEENSDGVVAKISTKFGEVVRAELDRARKRLDPQ